MKNLPWLFLSLIVVVCLSVAWLLATATGSRWLVSQLDHGVNELQISEFSGRMIDALQAESINYQNEKLSIEMQGVNVDYSLRELLKKQLTIKTLQIEKLRILLPDQAEKEVTQSEELLIPEFSLPLHMRIESLNIATLEIVRADKTQIIRNIELKAEMENNALSVHKLAVDYQKYQLRLTSSMAFAKSFPFVINAELSDQQAQTHGSLEIQGNADDYQLSLNGDIVNASIPDMTLALQATGDLHKLKIKSSTVQLLKGVIRSNGDISWRDGLALDLKYTGDDINPGQFDSRYAGKMNFSGQTKTQAGNLHSQLKIKGDLRGFPVDVDAQLVSEKTALRLDDVRIQVGNNQANITGLVTASGVQDVHYKLNAGSLSQLSPDLSGSIRGEGSASGEWDKLQLNAVLVGQSLAFKGSRMDALSLEIKPTDVQAYEYAITAKAIGVSTAKASVEAIQLSATASRDQQTVRFDLKDGPAGLRVSGGLRGKYQNNGWQGNLRSVQLTADNLPVYVQKQPAQLILSRKQQLMERFCLANGGEEFCIGGVFDPRNKSNLQASLNSLPIKRLSPWFPLAGELKDMLNSDITITGRNGEWHLATEAGLDDENRLQAKINFDQQSKSVEGAVSAQFKKLEWLNLLTDRAVISNGQLVAAIDISGLISKPRLGGIIQLQQAQMRVPDMGIELLDIALNVTLQGQHQALLSGSMLSDGNLSFDGDIDWHNLPEWQLHLALSGQRVKLLHIPVAKIHASPDLTLKLTQEGVVITGKLQIPEADVDLGNLPKTAIKPSSDEIIVGEEIKQKNTRYPVTANIQLEFGDKVALSGQGLETRLEGGLHIFQKPNQSVKGDGVLVLKDGTYQAYGQNLVIERGEIYFNGPMVPYLNIRATRSIETANVVAGLQLSGTLEQPESSVFAIPAMSETDALSYLLTGKPLGGGEGDSNLLMNAAVGLGIKGSEGLVEDIRSKTGLDTFELNSGEDSSQSYLALGKYLSPDFYIQYATKLFTQSQVFTMRYQLTDKLFLEAETGDDQDAVDLMYQFER
ncbi:MAG: translocation/assembly module TamB domain-containing protein [Gammaproteobacteria bacterium]